MLMFSLQRQNTMIPFFAIHVLVILQIPQNFGGVIAGFEYDDYNEINPSEENSKNIYGCNLRANLNLTDPLPDLDLPHPDSPESDLPGSPLNIPTETNDVRNPSIALPFKAPKSRNKDLDLQESTPNIPTEIDDVRNPSIVPPIMASKSRNKDLDLPKSTPNIPTEIDDVRTPSIVPPIMASKSRNKDLDLQESTPNIPTEINDVRNPSITPPIKAPKSRNKDLDLQESTPNIPTEIDDVRNPSITPPIKAPKSRNKDLDLPKSTPNIPTEIDDVRTPSIVPPIMASKSRNKDLDLLESTSNIPTENDVAQNHSRVTPPVKDKGKTKVPRHQKDIPGPLVVQVFQNNTGTTNTSRKILEEKELITNPDFEHNLDGWWCYLCRAQRVTGGYRTKYAAKIVNKGNRISSIRTSIKITPGRYYYTAHVKLLNPTNQTILYSKVVAHAKIYRRPKTLYVKLGETARVQPDTRWYKVGGDVLVPNGASRMEVYVQVWNTKLPYLFDQASCVRVDPVPNWKEEANKRIQEIRKANIQVRVNVTSIPKGYKLKITQTKEKFKWGAAVKTWLINNPSHRKFSEFIYKNFNWAVIENGLKWRNNEPTKGHVNLIAAKQTVDILLKNNLRVRGHTLFYSSADPPWVKQLKGNDLVKTLATRIDTVMPPFKNKISIWDVNNENLRSSVYEVLTQDMNITQKLFTMAHRKDPYVGLYFNENMVVNYGFNTVALEDRAIMYQEAGIPLHGIGIQSHMRGNIDVFLVMRRLNEVAKAGLPLFISELTYEHKDVQQRVISYDNLLRMYFSHPAVEGITFWIIWSNGWRQTSALLDQHFNVNEVGKLFLSLRSEWSTSPIEYDLMDRVKDFSVFLGDYRVELIKSGRTIWEKTLKIERAGSTTTFVIGRPPRGDLEWFTIKPS